MEKACNPEAEKKWYETWLENGVFRGENNSEKPSFSIFLPPPDVTGNLHTGHALTFTIPDIIVRRKKMQGFNTLWLPGPDHGGKEMQSVVTRAFVQLYRQGEIYRTAGPKGSKQWFLKTSGIAKVSIEVVKKGEITFIPEKWKNEYLQWMVDIGDWRISRKSRVQLGEGQRIPAYYCKKCAHLMVDEEKPGTCEKCGSTDIKQDQDVPDTWFSSALWPVTTLGPRDSTREFKEFFPIALMVTGAEGIFSQAARMIMMGVHLGKDVPFREVLITGRIRDAKGREVSEIIDKYGSDALRFTLAILAMPGMDISLSVSRVKGYKAFANKIWNASRYVLMNLEGDEENPIDPDKITEMDRWILNGLNNTIEKVNDRMDNYKIHEAADLLYHFFWHEYCDWYLEFSRNDIHNLDTRKTLKFSLHILLRLLHPFMPYITEEIFQKFNPGGKALLQTEFPAFSSGLVFSKEFVRVELLKKIIMETRKTRTENRVHPNRRIEIFLKSDSDKEKKAVGKNMRYFDLLAKSAKTVITDNFSGLPRGFRGGYRNWEILLPFSSEKVRCSELERLQKEMEKLENQIAVVEKKLSKNGFVDKASESVVSNCKKKLQQGIDKRNKIRKTIDEIS